MNESTNIFQKLIEKVNFLSRWYRRVGKPGRPGEVIETLSLEEKQELSKLTSDKVKDLEVHPRYWFDNYYNYLETSQKLSDIKLKFDKKLNK